MNIAKLSKSLLKSHTFIKVMALMLGIVFSVAVLSPMFSNVSFHADTLEIIQDNKEQAMSLTGLVTLASTALSLLPDDAASPLASELSDLSSPLLIIVCILYFEYFMLAPMEMLTFSILLPASLGVFAAYHCVHKKSLFVLATKLLLLAVVCAAVIPFSAMLTNLIEETFEHSVQTTFAKIEEVKIAFDQIGGNEGANAVIEFISGIKNGTAALIGLAKDLLGILIDAIAILIITCCVIPVITLLLFVWCVKSIIAGKMENLEDTAANVMKKIPNISKHIAERKALEE